MFFCYHFTLFFQSAISERAVSFIDGQNLFRHAKDAFGHHHPNYDLHKLTDAVCAANGWSNHGIRFYTGIPSVEHSPMWHGYWARRRTAMSRSGIKVTTRPLRYSNESVTLPDGTTREIAIPREKGIDLRLGLDLVRMARTGQLDVAVVFSQDQDLEELAREIRSISKEKNRWMKIVSAFPSGPNAFSKRGINRTDWFPIERELYDACLDPRDYRPNRQK